MATFNLKDGEECTVRWMIRRDMQEVLRIERESFPYPWTEDEFVDALKRRDVIGLVTEVKEEIKGFVLYTLSDRRYGILNLAVDPTFRRRGAGQALLGHLIQKLEVGRRDTLYADVRESNLEAQLFLRGLGFMAMETIRTPYEETDEDAYRMEYLVRSDEWSLDVSEQAEA